MYFVYVLHLYDDSLYKGYSTNVKQRILQYQSGKVTSTRHKRPFRIVLVECYATKSDAQRRERFLKTTEGRRLLRQQLRDTLQ